MDELEARLVGIPADAIFSHLNNAAHLVHLLYGQFRGPDKIINLYQDLLRASAANLRREIQSLNITVTDQELTIYLTRAASDTLTEALKNFQEQQAIMPKEEAITIEARSPAIMAALPAERYNLLIIKVLYGEFDFFPKTA